MKKSQKISLTFLRIISGWLLFYAGITKVLNPEWSAAGYLTNAKTFSGFYDMLLEPSILPVINILNEWGLTLLGVALLLGLFTRISSILAAVLMLLYYFPVLSFPYVGEHSFIVDDHIIYIGGFMILYYFNAGRYWGLDAKRLHYRS